MNKTMSREEKLFAHTPVWKSLLKMSIPAMFLMLIFGAYTFADNVLAINFADDSYKHYEAATGGQFKGGDFVRIFMAGVTPIPTFIFAITMLFGVGLSARYSINLGAKRYDKAKQVMSTTMQVALMTSFILMVGLMFVAKPWMKGQFDGDPRISALVADEGFKYAWIIIISFPIQIFNQITTNLLRAEAKNKETIIALVLPIFLNLGLDMLFMGPLKMGIEGGAWATFISYLVTTSLLIYFIKKNKSKIINFKNMFGRKHFNWIVLIGVALVGISPFLRNMAQSITQTFEMRVIQDVSFDVYGTHMQMSTIMSAVFPIYGLFFPIMFGFIQAGSPIIGYNYGARNLKRVKQTVWLIVLYSCITGGIVFALCCYVLTGPLLDILKIHNPNNYVIELSNPRSAEIISGITSKFPSAVRLPDMVTSTGEKVAVFNGIFVDVLDKSQKILVCTMLFTFILGFSLGAMALFTSTDRLTLNLLASTLRSIILIFPFMYTFSFFAQEHAGNVVDNLFGHHSIFTKEYLFWWFYPALGTTEVIVLTIAMVWTLKRLDRKHTPLEDRIQTFQAKVRHKLGKSKR